MSFTPKVTVVIANKNYRDFLDEAVNSVINQTYKNIQLVVVDDGSTDKSLEVLSRKLKSVGFSQNIPEDFKVVIHGKLNHIPTTLVELKRSFGRSRARNIGISIGAPNTDVFGILDSDDIWQPEKVEKSVPFFEDLLIGVVYTDYTCFHPDGLRIREHKEPFSRQRLMQDCIVNNSSLISKKAFDLCGLYDESFQVAEDWDLYLKISEKFMMVHIPESLVDIRIHKNNSTRTVDMSIWQESWHKISSKYDKK